MPDMKHVESSNVYSIGYDAASRIFAVRFLRKKKDAPHGGAVAEPAPEVYQHHDVPPEIGESFMAMDSGIGTAYTKQVRGKFAHQVVPA